MKIGAKIEVEETMATEKGGGEMTVIVGKGLNVVIEVKEGSDAIAKKVREGTGVTEKGVIVVIGIEGIGIGLDQLRVDDLGIIVLARGLVPKTGKGMTV